MKTNPNAVLLCGERCNGCDRCMKRCPTEAIRVRDGKAIVNYERCVGCGECVRVCPTHSKSEHYDNLEIIKNYKYKVALPSPSLYGQFQNLNDVNYVLTGLKKIGFDDVFEVGVGAEIYVAQTKKYIKRKKTKKPVIGTSCPAIKNLILMRHADLTDNLSPIMPPERITAELALARALKNTGFTRAEIGIFLITPCAANVIELKGSENIDGVLATKEVYFPLLAAMNALKPEEIEDLALASYRGTVCASNAGASALLNTENYLSASGVENAGDVLSQVAHERLNSFDFVDLYACTTGCTGGSMNIENCFLARSRLRVLSKKLPKKAKFRAQKNRRFVQGKFESNNVFALDEDRGKALEKTIRMKTILAKLPKLDCGNCGAPNCTAFAEDVVRGIKMRCKYIKQSHENGDSDENFQ